MRSGHVPIQTRYETRNALELSRYMRLTLLVNLLRPVGRAGKIDQKSRGLCLPTFTHLVIMPSEHPFMLEHT